MIVGEIGGAVDMVAGINVYISPTNEYVKRSHRTKRGK